MSGSSTGTNGPLAPLCQARHCDPCAHEIRRVLYVNSDPSQNEAFLQDLVHSGRCELGDDCVRPQLRCAGERVCWIAEVDPCVAVRRLHELYFNLVILDLRWSPAVASQFDQRLDRGLCLLDELDRSEDLEARYAFHRILVLVSGPDAERLDRLTVELGGRGVRWILRERWPGGRHEARDPDVAAAFAGRVVGLATSLTSGRNPGRTALCAAGGGITGIYFELGALKCLDDCLGAASVNDADMFFGISAGAVVAGLLAVGYSVAEIMAAIVGLPESRIGPVSLSLLRWQHLNGTELRARLRRTVRSAAERLGQVLRRRRAMALDGWVLDYSDVLGPPFQATHFERLLAGMLDRPGATNDFRQLPRPLYVGASDQDLRQHVLFGDEGWNHVPISRAIAASLAIHPAFAPVEIDGRFYEDGAVTRTSNFSEAIRRGASLVFVLDPFVPYVSRSAGFASQRGLLYNIDQDLRTVSFTRFENTRNWVLRKHPHVSSYTFLPSNRMRRLMSVNPMDHRPYLEIWRGAYLSTLQRLEHVFYRLCGDLRAHGLHLDLAPAKQVAERLQAREETRFEDFFPGGRVELRQHPLCLEVARNGEAVRRLAPAS